MSKLTREQTRRHSTAMALLQQDRLTDDDREQVFRDFHPGAEHMTGPAGAFFTPFDLAGDLAIEANGSTRILDVCAGIGVLSAFPYWRHQWSGASAPAIEIICVEINPAYCEIGRKLCPWATWINADLFDLTANDLGRFDMVLGNPPFGRSRRSATGPRYTGSETELHIIDHAAQFADYGAFIVPAMSAPFRYSGVQCFERRNEGRGVDFEHQTGIHLDVGAGVDCAIYRDQWVDAAPSVEIVTAEFTTAKPLQASLDLFGQAA